MMLLQQFLPTIRQISSKFFILQLYTAASATVCSGVCSRSMQNAWGVVLSDGSYPTRPHLTSSLFFVACTGFRWSSGSTTSWPCTRVYKSLRGQAPSYLVDDCQLIADSGCPAPLTPTFSLFREQALDLATEISRLLQVRTLEQSLRLTATAWRWIWTL